MSSKYYSKLIRNFIPAQSVLRYDYSNALCYSGTGTKVYDLSGNGNDGDLIGPPVYDGIKTFLFNGFSNKIVVPHSSTLNLTTNATIECWVNPANLNRNMSLFGKWFYNGGSNENSYYISIGQNANLNKIGGSIRQSSNIEKNIFPSNIIYQGIWYHIVLTFDNGISRLILNGVEIGNDTYIDIKSTPTTPVTIGGNAISSFPSYFVGNMATNVIYNTGMSVTEANNIFNSEKNKYGY